MASAGKGEYEWTSANVRDAAAIGINFLNIELPFDFQALPHRGYQFRIRYDGSTGVPRAIARYSQALLRGNKGSARHEPDE
jgi:hypothetical protein